MTDLVAQLVGALEDMNNGWKYIRRAHGDLYGVGWDRAQQKADAALSAAKDGGWLPIETAPIGVDVLLLSTRRRVHAFIGDWGDYNRYNHPRITHWQPLPNPPKGEV